MDALSMAALLQAVPQDAAVCFSNGSLMLVATVGAGLVSAVVFLHRMVVAGLQAQITDLKVRDTEQRQEIKQHNEANERLAQVAYRVTTPGQTV
jgi:hypothetical protein